MTKHHARHALLLTTFLALGAGCSGGDDPDVQSGGGGPTGPMTSGVGGAPATTTSSSTGAAPTGGSGGNGPVMVEEAVGAAYAADGRVVLIDASGTRVASYNPNTGAFTGSDDLDELEGSGPPLADVRAAGTVDNATYMVDASGQIVVYDRSQGTFSAPDDLDEILEDIPFSAVGAAFGFGDQLFVFNQGGASYAAYDVSDQTWSSVFSFTSDFGGGGGPIASVGAAAPIDDDAILLFSLAGDEYCIYSTNNGTFSDDFDLDELGDGTLRFNDTADD
ncbi:MAG: hypothetical protein AAGN82_29080 [Myxococcota bacterium]